MKISGINLESFGLLSGLIPPPPHQKKIIQNCFQIYKKIPKLDKTSPETFFGGFFVVFLRKGGGVGNVGTVLF
jgi:hypothetical protein